VQPRERARNDRIAKGGEPALRGVVDRIDAGAQQFDEHLLGDAQQRVAHPRPTVAKLEQREFDEQPHALARAQRVGDAQHRRQRSEKRVERMRVAAEEAAEELGGVAVTSVGNDHRRQLAGGHAAEERRRSSIAAAGERAFRIGQKVRVTVRNDEHVARGETHRLARLEPGPARAAQHDVVRDDVPHAGQHVAGELRGRRSRRRPRLRRRDEEQHRSAQPHAAQQVGQQVDVAGLQATLAGQCRLCTHCRPCARRRRGRDCVRRRTVRHAIRNPGHGNRSRRRRS